MNKPIKTSSPAGAPAGDDAKHSRRSESPKQLTKVIVRPVVNAIGILRYMTSVTKPVTVSLVARQLNLNLSTTFNLLRTLVHERLVKFDEDTRTYTIGVGVFDLSQAALAEGGTIPVVRPKMENLARKYDTTITVWRRVDETHMMLVALADSEANMRIHMNIGQRVPLMTGAMGRLMAAYSSDEEANIRSLFDAVRWQKALSFDTFMTQVRKAKREGWAIDDGYFSKGTVTISAPVFDRFERVHMACSATMFSGQHSSESLASLAGELVEISATLSQALAIN